MSLETDVPEKALGTLTDPTKILKAVLWLGDRNNAKARAEFLEAIEDQNVTNAQRLDEMERLVDRVLEMVIRPEEWKEHESEKPTRGDVIARAEEFKRDAEGAGSHGKRKILWNAFRSSFKPEFYVEGWSTHLWRIAEHIEYPECLWLAERIEKKDHPNVLESSRDYFFVQRLKQLGLVATLDLGRSGDSPLSLVKPFVTEVGLRFKEFVQDDKVLPAYPLPTRS